MKKIIGLIAIAISSINTYSQATHTEYSELGALISDDSYNGSARFTAMSGSFGAIGGDISCVSINPAGAAVGLYNQLSFTLANNTTDTKSSFSGNKIDDNKSKNSDFNLYHASASMAFECSEQSKWKRVSLFFNYQIKNSFDSNFIIDADHSKYPDNKYQYLYFKRSLDPNDNNVYDNLIQQKFERTRTGKSTVVNLGLAGLTKDNFYLGGSINFHDFYITEINKLNERSKSNNNTELKTFNSQELFVEGNGVSLSMGGIYKLKQFRAGLSFETPTFYSEITETSNTIDYPEDNDDRDNNNVILKGYTETETTTIYETFDEEDGATYNFKSPLRLTASIAWVFAKKGLINVDYSYRNFSSMSFSDDGDFYNEHNKYTTKTYTNTSSLNIGTEWKFNKLKLRAGYEYKQDPNSATKDNTHLKSISTGIGYSYKNLLFDLSYTRRNYNKNYNLYNNNDILNSNISNKIGGTITFQI